MECLPCNKESLKKAIQVLKKGGVIAHPADTCFGLAADLMNPKAVKKTQDIKGRDRNKPMSVMLPAYMQAEISRFAKLDDFSKDVCNKLLPGPVTILLPKGPKIPDYFFPKSNIVGIRIPNDMMTQDLLTGFKGPLITTSANLSNQPPCSTCEEVKKIFRNKKHKPDILFEGAIRNICLPSTVVVIENGKIKITRKGPVTKKQLEGILGVEIA